ncbi:Laccase-4 [Asimina triloba]
MEPWPRAIVVVACLLLATVAEGRVRHYKFNLRAATCDVVVLLLAAAEPRRARVMMKNETRLCHSKPIVTVNGQFPGPTLYAREGDNVLVKVVNHIKFNVTIHWHGIKQLRTGWADGPAYITQCPIQPGNQYVYNFTITGQRGTLWWHAHILWLRATVHGAIVILPKLRVPYPFPTPDKEVVVILGEWWKSDTEAVINEALQSGLAPNVSDAHTINGHPGPNANCSSEGGFTLQVRSGKTYMLRLVNAALNEELFFKVAGHKLTVVEVDATYTKPLNTDTVLITPGQTTNVLLTAGRASGRYLVTASPFMDAPIAVDNATATAILHYKGTLSATSTILTTPPPQNATPIANTFNAALRSLNSNRFPALVPKTVDRSLQFTIGLGANPCSTCKNGIRVVADINNVSFVMPTTALLQAHFFNISGVFTADFPGNPPTSFNYTGAPPSNLQTTNGTRLYRLPFNSTVQLVLQDTGIIAPESHPIHLHGFNFFAVGRGLGNFNRKTDPAKFNLVDPVERNTIGVPTGGWIAIRFRADNPVLQVYPTLTKHQRLRVSSFPDEALLKFSLPLGFFLIPFPFLVGVWASRLGLGLLVSVCAHHGLSEQVGLKSWLTQAFDEGREENDQL